MPDFLIRAAAFLRGIVAALGAFVRSLTRKAPALPPAPESEPPKEQ
jgi:hypothetical protein